MKKVTLIVALCISMLAFSSTAADPVYGIKIKFGKPSKDCKKFGICNITIVIDWASIVENLFANVEERTGYGLTQTTESAKLQINFVKEYMTQLTLKSFFQDGKFIVEEDYALDPSVASALNLAPGYVIKKGVYKYMENAKEIILIL